MSTLMTPQLHAAGVYSLRPPFNAAANTVYECKAIRSFDDLLQDGVDPVVTVYAPVGLGAAEYNADRLMGANIITLMSGTLAPVHVPDSYIVSFPQSDLIPYSVVVGSFMVGPVPDTLDLSYLIAAVGNLVSETMGLTPVVKLHKLPSTGVVTAAQDKTIQEARKAAIINATTDHAQLLALRTQYTSLQAKYNALVAALSK